MIIQKYGLVMSASEAREHDAPEYHGWFVTYT